MRFFLKGTQRKEAKERDGVNRKSHEETTRNSQDTATQGVDQKTSHAQCMPERPNRRNSRRTREARQIRQGSRHSRREPVSQNFGDAISAQETTYQQPVRVNQNITRLKCVSLHKKVRSCCLHVPSFQTGSATFACDTFKHLGSFICKTLTARELATTLPPVTSFNW